MIKELHLKNWKSFRDSKLYIDPLTILIGTNASGKSNILDALVFLQKTAMGKQVNAAINGDVESKGIRGGMDWAIAHGANEAEIVVVVQSGIDESIDYEYSLKIGRVSPFKIEIKAESLVKVKHHPLGMETDTRKKLFYTDNENLADPSIKARFPKQAKDSDKAYKLRRESSVLHQSKYLTQLPSEVLIGIAVVETHLASIFVLDPIPSLMRDYTAFSDTLLPDASNISGVLAALEKDQKEKVESILTDYLRRLPEKDIFRVWTEPAGKFGRDAMLYCEEKWHAGDTLTLDARGMSDGTLRFLAIMTALLTIEENSLLVVEEIDNGFHPSRAKLLVEFLKEVGAERNIDVVCTTHNPAFLDALGNEMIVFISVVHRNSEDGTSEVALLEDVEDLPKLIARGTLGRLTSMGVIEDALAK